MPDRSSVFERVSIARETTSGTAVVPRKTLASMAIKPSVKVETKQFAPAGNKFDTTSTLNKEWTESPVEGVVDFNELPYALCSVFRNVAPVTPGGGTLSREWTVAPTVASADTPASYTVEAGSEIRAERSTYGLFSEFGVKYTRSDGLTVSGALMSQRTLDDKVRYLYIQGATGGTFTVTVGAQTTSGIAHGATASTIQTAIAGLSNVGTGNVTVTVDATITTLFMVVFGGTLANTELPEVSVSGASLTGTSPTAMLTRVSPVATQSDVKPAIPTQVEIKVANTFAGLTASTNVLTRVLEFEWKLSGRWGPIWTINRNVDSWAAPVELKPGATVSLKVGADEIGMSYLNTLRRGDTVYVRVDATGDTIESTLAYQFRTDIAFKITDISPKEDTDGLVSVTYTGTIVSDATSGKAIECFVRNVLTAL